jgi:hypothetical protein
VPPTRDSWRKGDGWLSVRGVGRLAARLHLPKSAGELSRTARRLLSAARAGWSAARGALGQPEGASTCTDGGNGGEAVLSVPPAVAPFVTLYPPGHFYSPVPDWAEVAPRADALFSPDRPLPGIDLREDEQLDLFRTLAALARDAPLEEIPGKSTRYGVANPNYGIGDASMLHAMLRHLRPRRYLEVGSGYTTALALDVRERFLGGEIEVTAIEPYPDLLYTVLRPGDAVEVLAQPVQEVPLDRFRSLEANDVLFVDCSHVAKVGSDAAHLYTQVLPVLAEGVVVHVHDVFWPFEYLRHWVEQGRAWNEAYLLHAFLLFNDAFEILLWNHYLAMRHRQIIEAELPRMLENPGGAIWLRRTSGERTVRPSQASR